jgi:Tfp pilus assembly protein FimT
MKHAATTARNSRGFTLVELCAAVGICGTLLAQALPAMSQLRQEQKLRASSETLMTDLRLARAESNRLDAPVYVRVSGKGAQACYVLHTGAKDDCDCAGGQAVCKSATASVIKAEWLPASQPVRIRSNAESMQFQHRQGLVTQTGSIDLSLDSGTTIRQVIAITGRARTCYTSARLAGMPKCK